MQVGQIIDINRQILEQQEKARQAKTQLDERERAKKAPEQEYAEAQAAIAQLERQRAETLFSEALEQNNEYLSANREAIERLHAAMASPVDFGKVRQLVGNVQATFESQQQHARRAVDNMERFAPATPYRVPAWMPLAAKFTPAIDADEALIWFIHGKQGDQLMEARAVVYVFLGQIFQVPAGYDPVNVMRSKLSARR